MPLWWWIITRFWRWLLNAWIIMGWEEPYALWITAHACTTSLSSLAFHSLGFFPADKVMTTLLWSNWNHMIRDFSPISPYILWPVNKLCHDLAPGLLLPRVLPKGWVISLFSIYFWKRGGHSNELVIARPWTCLILVSQKPVDQTDWFEN